MRLSYFIILILIMLPSFASEITTSLINCKSKGWLEKKYKEIYKYSSYRDVTKDLKKFNAVAKYGCSDLDSAKIKEILSPIEIRGHKNFIGKMVYEARIAAKYREPKHEFLKIEEAKQALRDLGVDSNEIPGGLSASEKLTLRNRGKANSQSRKVTCTNKNNLKKPLIKDEGSLSVHDMRDQDSIGWCYAYTAADLLSYETGKKISAVDIANSHNDGSLEEFFGISESNIEGGDAAAAGRSALKRGLCLEKKLPSDDFVFSTRSKNFEDKLKEVESLYNQFYESTHRTSYNIFGTSIVKVNDAEVQREKKSIAKNIRCNPTHNDIRKLFPNLSLEDILNIIVKSDSDNDFIDRLTKESCKPRFKPSSDISFSKYETGLFTDSEDVLKKVDSLLDKGKISGISYYASVLDEPYGVNDGRHASSIVARKFDPSTGSCKYLVRNSWGTGCGSYNDMYNCESGNIWIPEEYMSRAIYRATYVD